MNLFFEQPDELACFELVAAEAMPAVSRKLLAHNHHMTVTVEGHHECLVDVEVLGTHTDGDYYSRKILLNRQSDGGCVQYGIVRLNLGFLAADVRTEIEAQQRPLGRVLIEHDVLREVKLLNLFRIRPGQEMANHLGLESGEVCFGRTALIYCDGKPAIELLEVVN